MDIVEQFIKDKSIFEYFVEYSCKVIKNEDGSERVDYDRYTFGFDGPTIKNVMDLVNLLTDNQEIIEYVLDKLEEDFNFLLGFNGVRTKYYVETSSGIIYMIEDIDGATNTYEYLPKDPSEFEQPNIVFEETNLIKTMITRRCLERSDGDLHFQFEEKTIPISRLEKLSNNETYLNWIHNQGARVLAWISFSSNSFTVYTRIRKSIQYKENVLLNQWATLKPLSRKNEYFF